MARFGKTVVLEKLIKHRGPLKENTTGTSHRLKIAVVDSSYEMTVRFRIGPTKKLP